MCIKFYTGSLNGSDDFGDLCIDARIILKLIIKIGPEDVMISGSK
jgi:hypothetical protein